MKSVFLLFSLILSTSAQAVESAKNTCEQFETPISWSYCVTEVVESSNQNVLYFLHGGGMGDFKQMQADTFEGLRKEWSKLGVSSPRIIQISFGRIWALTPKDENPNGGLLDFFLESAMPYIEKGILKSSVQKRLLWGHSMGGLNSSILALRAPELFVKIAMTSPAPIIGVSPFASEKDIHDYATRMDLPLDFVVRTLAQYLLFIGSQETFENISVVYSGPRILNSQTPPFYISGSEKDIYYYGGITQLLKVAQDAGVNVTWDLRPNGHGDINGPALAKFLVP